VLPNKEDGTVLRIHSEDLAQALSVDPSKKYTSDGGPSAMRIAELLRATAVDDSLKRFVRAVIANYLLAAPDAHAKNYSLLLVQRQVTLAPLYDVATGLTAGLEPGTLRYKRAAMAIGGQNRFGDVNASDLQRFAVAMGVDHEFVRETAINMANTLPDAMRDAFSQLPRNIHDGKVIKDVLLPRLASYTKHALVQFKQTAKPNPPSRFFDTL
jgi:serine/threonine-protein kinase HipA